jgi:cephalosporin hydroxylase
MSIKHNSKNQKIINFFKDRQLDINKLSKDKNLRNKSIDWMLHADTYKYTYNFTWMGRPIIKFPADMIVQQEIFYNVRPDLIIETGVAHGGSLLFNASIQKLLGIDNSLTIGIDIDTRKHNREEILNSPLSDHIQLIDGSSTDKKIFDHVCNISKKFKTILVILDSLHTHDHVLEELKLYSSLVTSGSYLILPDTFIEFFPKGYYEDRPWDVGNNPYTAMIEFLKNTDEFQIDEYFSSKAVITETIDGYLKKIK